MTFLEKLYNGAANADKVIEGYGNLLIFKREDIEALARHRTEICSNCDKQSFLYVDEKGERKTFVGTTIDFHNMIDTRMLHTNHKVHLANACTQCGCGLPAKVRSTSSSCPLKKWEAVKDEAKILGKEITRVAIEE